MPKYRVVSETGVVEFEASSGVELEQRAAFHLSKSGAREGQLEKLAGPGVDGVPEWTPIKEIRSIREAGEA